MRFLIIILLSLISFVTQSQNLINNKEIQLEVQKGLDHMYNFEFTEAEEKFTLIKTQYPEHPSYYFLMSMLTAWKMVYNNNFKEKNHEQKQLLEKSIEKSRKMLEKDHHNPEAIFFTLAGYSSMALLSAQKEEYMDAVSHARKAYSYMKEGMKMKDTFHEFYFSCGIYDYFVVKYPENRPAFKPFMIFFPNGDKERGIKELDFISHNGTYTKVEAIAYLTNIYLKYENMPSKAITYSQQLVDKYPKNMFFLVRHVEGLIGNNKWYDAQLQSYHLNKSGEKFFVMTSYVFHGMIYEKHYKDLNKAEEYYNYGLKMTSQLTVPMKDYESFAYTGLARIAHARGNTEKAVEYYKKAMKVAQYTWVIKESEAYLKEHD